MDTFALSVICGKTYMPIGQADGHIIINNSITFLHNFRLKIHAVNVNINIVFTINY